MKPIIYGPKFMWNLSGSVGKGASNSDPTDVSFIQWYYTLSRDFHLTTPQAKAIYSQVNVTGKCTGQDSDPLVQAIRSQHTETKHPIVDGKISVVAGDGKLNASGHAFFLLRLEARLAVMYPNKWPRLDLIPRCPNSVAEVSRFAIPTMAELMH